MSINDLIAKIASRASELANQKMDLLRLSYPEYVEGGLWEAKKITLGMTRGQLVEAVLLEEFCEEFPIEMNEE